MRTIPARTSAAEDRVPAPPRLEDATTEGGGGRWGHKWKTLLGGVLLLLGIVILGQAFHLDLRRVGWSAVVILLGAGLLGLGLALDGRPGAVLATVGGVVTMVMLVVLSQNATNRVDTWAYAGTLGVLVGGGAGQWLLGVVRGHRDLAARGRRLILAGLAAFLVFAIFFEVIVGISGRRYGPTSRYILSALLILAGLAILGRRLRAARQP
jgi:hypothetical protein